MKLVLVGDRRLKVGKRKFLFNDMAVIGGENGSSTLNDMTMLVLIRGLGKEYRPFVTSIQR